ncbi:type I DNA topoisomerase [Candidatus Gracilibacteria bacterium]|nr:type I DNA topoisomerase [Candidatus Gracilibacteria bacterium]MCF7856158.1 type I DNA topoisomerase [Candidatus Gracilibacteria bacterium]MCF7896624.1 type I DNA topoisomerase [Candidatus Gracilibacteria bacterium]
MNKLVIVESPAKARTITKFLGPKFTVRASMGHVRDLPKSKMGIDTEGGTFLPEYILSRDKTKVIAELTKLAKSADEIILATDEDREGEAIAWHLLAALKIPKTIKTPRIVFHEITKAAIEAALKNPRELDRNLIDAQQARRVLDRLMGYELSPLIWKKIRYGLSAGRVQSVAVRLIVEREREVDKFNPVEYWTLGADLETPRGDRFTAELSKIDSNPSTGSGQRKAEVKTKNEAEKIQLDLKKSEFKVSKIDKKERIRRPAAPFITSTLQAEASRKLGFSVKKTMMLAQRLYEGSDVDEGLITYMRTDSTNLAASAAKSARTVIENKFGKNFVPEKVRSFTKKAKGAQEAHEAIRPTDPARFPESLKGKLEDDAFRLYELIWQRFLACQMEDAVLDQTGVDISAKDYIFRATGQIVKFAGWLAAYSVGYDSEEEAKEDSEKLLPEILENEVQKLLELKSEQHFTKPPARYTEATLIKKLEAEGIGRPSTYAPTISTVQNRGYVEKEGRALKPTDTGMVVNDFLVKHFPKIVDFQFTAKMELQLDEIAEGQHRWVEIMKDFYKPFHTEVIEKTDSIKKEDVVNETTDEICDKCGKPMVIKLGRFGKFLSCSAYPDCKNAKPLDKKQEAAEIELNEKIKDQKCPECGKLLTVKRGRFGMFVGCSGYPDCKFIEKKANGMGIKCPDCGKGEITEKFARKTKKKFWGCTNYPDCKFASWDEPQKTPCECGGVIVHKLGKNEKLICMKCAKERKA